MKNNNIFEFATSELSQDAYICWLVNWINFKYENLHLYRKAKLFLDNIMGKYNIEDYGKVDIYKQFDKIDVLLVIKDKYLVIIEDKTYTHEHGEQIQTYKKALLNKKDNRHIPNDIKDENIICVYYKTVDEFGENKNADIIFDREKILDVLNDKDGSIDSDIYNDYYEYLMTIDDEAKSYKNGVVECWNWQGYYGFYKYLESKEIDNNVQWWGYVANKSGGFMCFCWHYKENYLKDRLKGKNILKQLKLQLELSNKKGFENVICVKGKLEENQQGSGIRYKIYEFIREYLKKEGYEYHKKTFRDGETISIGHINVNGKNYEEVMKAMNVMEKALDECVEYLIKGEVR